MIGDFTSSCLDIMLLGHWYVDLWTWRLFLVPLNCLSEPELFLSAFGPETSGRILNSSLKEDTNCTGSFFLSFFFFFFLICFYTEYGKDCQTGIEKSWRKIKTMMQHMNLCSSFAPEWVWGFFFLLKRKASVCFLNKTLIRVSSSLCSTWYSPQN